MRYVEITSDHPKFQEITLINILRNLRYIAQRYVWSIQLIEAVGNVEPVVGMNMLELERICDNSKNGLSVDFETLIGLAKLCDDIEDIVIIACNENAEIPKAYKIEKWESLCEIIISKEDSSLWQLYSSNENVMKYFSSLVD